jgi:hypothetical protein
VEDIQQVGFDGREGREWFGKEENSVSAVLKAEGEGRGLDVFFWLWLILVRFWSLLRKEYRFSPSCRCLFLIYSCIKIESGIDRSEK